MTLFLMAGTAKSPLRADLLAIPSVRQCFASMFASTRLGATGEEIGAFLIEQPDGSLSCRRWPHTGQRRVEWRGVLPDRTIAVVHTHPASAPLPSQHDRDEAAKRGIPFIVISSFRVTATHADGSSLVLGEPGWMELR